MQDAPTSLWPRMRRSVRRWTRLAVLLAVAVAVERSEAGPLPGPIPAEVIRVVDGDTLEVRAEIWVAQTVVTFVRLAGIDAPELRGACGGERTLAAAATERLRGLLPPGARLLLHEVEHGKFAGRVIARVTLPDGRDLGAGLLLAGLAQPYAGGRRAEWC